MPLAKMLVSYLGIQYGGISNWGWQLSRPTKKQTSELPVVDRSNAYGGQRRLSTAYDSLQFAPRGRLPGSSMGVEVNHRPIRHDFEMPEAVAWNSDGGRPIRKRHSND
jgi:hypothetical protein